ncbi:hypothetical protein ACIQVK_32210 [Streptomyces sp. NPDC090493]|uniref:hypothetical protein n=1 Tax=Streptomyces sp. NPDC090493 TaxID=3365964 RepID=UPI0038001B9D
MSYDIYFVRPRPVLDWDELAEELEEAADAAPDLPKALIAAWERMVPHLTEALGQVELSRGARTRKLSHDDTGIELSIIGDEVSLTIPYWHTREAAGLAFEMIAAIVSIVERETGLIAFDPQTERPFTEAIAEAEAVMSSNTEDLHRRYGK